MSWKILNVIVNNDKRVGYYSSQAVLTLDHATSVTESFLHSTPSWTASWHNLVDCSENLPRAWKISRDVLDILWDAFDSCCFGWLIESHFSAVLSNLGCTRDHYYHYFIELFTDLISKPKLFSTRYTTGPYRFNKKKKAFRLNPQVTH